MRLLEGNASDILRDFANEVYRIKHHRGHLVLVDEYTAEVGVTNYAQSNFVVLVGAKDDVYLKGTVVDYVREGLNEGFKFSNPNERDRCGCGESFRV